ncbi:MAG: ATP-binding protein [Candidatus Omnitrophica bacterium]|nr:ATP-binding protein [Candidatus Omnitrophota bacterium]
MKIEIRGGFRKQLGVIEVDINSIISEAETRQGRDPVVESVAILREEIELNGFKIEAGELAKIQVELSKALASGEFPTDFSVRGSKLENTGRAGGGSGALRTGETTKPPSEVFESVIEYPNESAESEYKSLIGLDDIKLRLVKECSLILSSENLEKWSKKHHRKVISACAAFEKRPPLVVFGGDIGTGKTALAESFGDPVARLLKTKVSLFRISVQTRGTGLVGEMTQLINKAFREARKVAQESRCPAILLVDEADTLAQSREAVQMHHEDKAGVNALIQGIDRIRSSGLPMLVVFCTNRLGAIDPAIIRRAAIVHQFVRPGESQLRQMFEMYFGDIGLTETQLQQLVRTASPSASRKYGFTYSDIVNKVIPSAIMQAYPDKPLTLEIIAEVLKKVVPTPPFKEGE